MKKIENNHFEIKAVPSTEYALEGVMNKLYVLLEIKGKKQPRPEEEKERDPIDLSLVLDRSGSMGGSKIDFAKKGVEYAVSNLRADDRVTLVIYDDQIEVLFQGNPAKKRKEFLEKIETVYARNSTALYDAMKRGYKELKSRGNRKKRIFLFSDGLANVGERRPDMIRKLAGDIYSKAASVSAFGIGDDFDEQLMAGIAEMGRGDYHYIEDPDQIPIVMEEALEGVVNILAMDLKMTITGTNGATVIKAFSYDSPANISMPIYREEDVMEILVEIDVIPEKMGQGGEFLKFKMEYSDQDEPLESTDISGVFSIGITSDENLIMEENRRVMEFVELERVKERELEIQKKLRERDFDGAILLQKKLIDDLTGLGSKEQAILDKIQMMEVNAIDLEYSKKQQNYARSMKSSMHSSYLSSMGSSRRVDYLDRMRAKHNLDEEDED